MENKKTFYITTPIYYPSANLHIGHALTTVMADAISRYKRMRGFDVMFLTGSDEHGQKIERTAKEKGVKPIEYVDKIVAGFEELWKRLHISNDDFIRTTQKRHQDVVQDIFKKIYENGDIYKSEYEGKYCTPCETFFTERQLAEGNCPDCGRPVETIKEESYFFKMSKYQDKLLAHIENNPDFIEPVSRRNEMINFIKQGLEDLCISRTTFDWGIPVPLDEKHVIYVWFDALTNYISALNYGMENDELYQKFWPADIHLVGKDIVRFHTIIWPTILMAADISLPKKIYGHGWLLLDNGKMSKSKGNVVDPNVLIDKYGVDAIRFYLLREIPAGADGFYSEESFVQRYNMDLANDFGNLVSRTVAMIDKYFGGTVPVGNTKGDFDDSLIELSIKTSSDVENNVEKLDFANALAAIFKLIGRANKYIDETTPWILAKDENQKDRLGTVLYNLLETIRISTILLKPFMPVLPEKVSEQIGMNIDEYSWDDSKVWGKLTTGIKVCKKTAIFPRVDPKLLENTEPNTNTVSKEVSKPIQEKAEDLELAPEVSIDDFAKLDLRIVEVLTVEKVPKTDKLLKFEVKLGDEVRTVVSGIAKHYDPAELVGKKVVLVANLKPVKLRGIISQGMILSASSLKDDMLEVLSINKELPSGSRVK
ncbi:methionyl-tRNA synthetase [Desulfonispora thiosulfatigenes DSM 11270]|uniref:Methionine--tRNA ligase n=1 Tax=Desulfonispora thiosulfatigenes DSM 11270 TaxID=656914 RepID=A0A1W1V0N6_DESTI|nr:methionine--tRNA ligase [Desulfonispora thiosulfatigenes]SMB86873.1 methionyl-tRNA synthetase [Desulfonispora thiosulfatigenes DSM 11270]